MRSGRCFAWALLAVGLILAAWSIATPLMASPDEPAQVSQAAALVRGQLDRPQHDTPIGKRALVTVPDWVASAGALPDCYAFRPAISAGCAPRVSHSTTSTTTFTQFSNYPPLYYAMVGLPSLVFTGSPAVYAMRGVGDLIDGLLLALGLFLLARYHPRRLPLVGALFALTPMVFFVSSVVNESGMEIAAGFAAWCGGLCLAESDDPPKGLVAGTSIGLATLVLSRPISPYYGVVIVVVLSALAGWTRVRALLRNQRVRVLAAVAAGAAAVACFFLVLGGIPSLLGVPAAHPVGLLGAERASLDQLWPQFLQTIGKFGWLDTPAPLLTTVTWLTGLAVLVTLSLIVSAPCRRALPLLAVAIVVTPLLFEAPEINTAGTYWQGRYWLPITVGLPLVASAMHRTRRRSRRHAVSRSPWRVSAVIAGTGLVLAVAQVAAFLTALHRYQTGLGAKPGTPVSWIPPGGTVQVVALLVVGQVLLVTFAVWVSFTPQRGRRSQSQRLRRPDLTPSTHRPI